MLLKIFGTKKSVVLLITATMLAMLLCIFSILTPISRKADTVREWGEKTASQLEGFALALSYYEGDDLQALSKNPSTMELYVDTSSILAKAANHFSLSRTYVLYRGLEGKYYYLGDSAYRSNGTAGIDYNDLGAPYQSELYTRKCKTVLDKVFSGNQPLFVEEIVGINTVINYQPITNAAGEVIAVLGADTPLPPTTFHKIAFVDLNLTAVMSGWIFAIGAFLLLALLSQRKKQAQKPQAQPAPSHNKALLKKAVDATDIIDLPEDKEK